jgi:hypothetical protein
MDVGRFLFSAPCLRLSLLAQIARQLLGDICQMAFAQKQCPNNTGGSRLLVLGHSNIAFDQ